MRRMLWIAFPLLLPLCLHAQRNRLPLDAASVEAGRQIYMGSCSGCHGATGEGSQGPSLLSGRASRLADQALISAIKNGLPGTSMPNFPMADDKVGQVAAFVRSLTAPAISMQAPGDAERGKQLFFEAGKCAGCHMIGGQGGYPGPDLSNVGADRTMFQIRESIVKPSARIAEGYRGAAAAMKSGRTIEGVAKNFNNYSVQILDRTGRLHLLNRDEISNLEIKEGSLMPPVTDANDARDLIAFLAKQSMRKREGGSR